MAFNPNLPVAGAEIDAVELRAQFNGLHDEIAAVPAGPPGPGLVLRGEFVFGTVYGPGDVVTSEHLVFLCVTPGTLQGPTDGTPPPWQLVSIVGPQGEVSAATLGAAVADTPHNCTAVSVLGLAVSDPPTQAEMQQVVAKVDALITALRREP